MYCKVNKYDMSVDNQLLKTVRFHISGDDAITYHMIKKWVEHKDTFIDNVYKESLPHKFLYKHLKYRGRLRRVQNLAEKTMMVCVDRKCLKEERSLYAQEVLI